VPTKAEQRVLARIHVREAELRVQNQATLIEMLRHDNYDSKLAEAMLSEYRKALEQSHAREREAESEQEETDADKLG